MSDYDVYKPSNYDVYAMNQVLNHMTDSCVAQCVSVYVVCLCSDASLSLLFNASVCVLHVFMRLCVCALEYVLMCFWYTRL